jgi:hypothetical protein
MPPLAKNRLLLGCELCEYVSVELRSVVGMATQLAQRYATNVTGQLAPTRFTAGRVRQLKNSRNSVTVQNRTLVYMNFFHHKDVGNHLLQL